MLTLLKPLNKESSPHSKDIIQVIAKMFNGKIINPDNHREYYSKKAFKLLDKKKVISRQSLWEYAMIDCWDWFIKEYSDCLRSEDSIHFKSFE